MPKSIQTLLRSASRAALFTALCMALFMVELAAQTTQLNPLESDPRAARVGGGLFRAQCATCHGGDAKGISSIEAPDLTLLWAEGEKTDAEVFASIRNGVPGSIMPPHGYTDPEIWMLVSFLHSIAVVGTNQRFSGNSDHGQQLFLRNCSRCHRVDSTGGSLGPDLTRILSQRSPSTMISSIREPSASVGRRYKQVVLLTAEQLQVRGNIKSEDAFSIQIMNIDQQLQAFMKEDLIDISRPADSLMPEFDESALSEDDLVDLLSYLQSQL